MKLQTNKQLGFTLIELMIVVAVIGILSAIAYPAYTEQMRKARRSDAAGVLMGLASAMERHYTETGGYTAAADGGSDTGDPAIYSTKSPIDGSDTYYNLTIFSASSQAYEVRATPATGGPQAGDACGTLSLTHQGTKGASGGTVDVCW